MTGRSAVLAAMVMAIAAIGATAASGTVPRFVWNLSGSVPIGLYGVRPAGDLTVTTLVVAYPPEPLETWLAEGRYLPRAVPLLKPILALEGRRSAAPVASSRSTDARGASQVSKIIADARSRSGRAAA